MYRLFFKILNIFSPKLCSPLEHNILQNQVYPYMNKISPWDNIFPKSDNLLHVKSEKYNNIREMSVILY